LGYDLLLLDLLLLGCFRPLRPHRLRLVLHSYTSSLSYPFGRCGGPLWGLLPLDDLTYRTGLTNKNKAVKLT
jgi:hypothetical protein